MSKSQIRESMRAVSRTISQKERIVTAEKILEEALKLPQFKGARNIALYCELPDEVPTSMWIERFTEMGHRLFIPRIEGETMEFYEYNSEELRKGSFGITEPTASQAISTSDIDIMFVPGVAFSRNGARLGRGKGFYDRYISRTDFRAYTIGVGYSYQLLEEIPTEPHDRKLDRVIAPFTASPIPDIVRKIVESAWVDADKIGCGINILNSMGYSWVLLRFKMQLSRTIDADEELQIETWISSCSRVVTSRNFIIKDRFGETLGEAISQWCMIDLATRRPTDLTRSEINYPQFVKTQQSGIELTRKLPAIDINDSSLSKYTHCATEYDIDFNNHVNTFRYIEMMLHTLPRTTLANRGECCVDIQFVHESYLGETLTIIEQEQRSDEQISSVPHSIFEILRPDGSTAVKAVFELN